MIFTGVEKKGNLFLICFLLSLFFISLVGAVPPVQSTTLIDKGIQIEAPIIETHESLQNFTFHIHAHNVSDGLILTDSSIEYCSFHLYDNKGIHIIEANMTFDVNGMDWEYLVLGANFTREGAYAALFYCEVQIPKSTQIIGGFYEYPFYVTPTGFSDTYGFYVLIILISAVLIIWGYRITDPWITIFGSFGLYFTGLYIILNGIVGIKDLVTTWAIGIIFLGVAAYISIRSAIEVING